MDIIRQYMVVAWVVVMLFSQIRMILQHSPHCVIMVLVITVTQTVLAKPMHQASVQLVNTIQLPIYRVGQVLVDMCRIKNWMH